MHDEVLVGVLDRRADLAEEAQALVDREAAAVAVLDQRLALDVLHDEVGLAAIRRAAVEEARDVGMLEGGRDLALAAKSLAREVARHAGPDELDRHLLLELVVGAPGKVDHPHAAVAELGDQLVGPDALPGAARSRRILEERPDLRRRRSLDERPVRIGGRRERLDLPVEPLVSRAAPGQKRRTFRRGDVERLVEKPLDLLPALGGHRRAHRPGRLRPTRRSRGAATPSRSASPA